MERAHKVRQSLSGCRFEVLAPAAAEKPGMHAFEQVKVPDTRDAGRLRRRTPASAVSVSRRRKAIFVLGDPIPMLTHRAETGCIAPTRHVEKRGVPRGIHTMASPTDVTGGHSRTPTVSPSRYVRPDA